MFRGAPVHNVSSTPCVGSPLGASFRGNTPLRKQKPDLQGDHHRLSPVCVIPGALFMTEQTVPGHAVNLNVLHHSRLHFLIITIADAAWREHLVSNQLAQARAFLQSVRRRLPSVVRHVQMIVLCPARIHLC